jgi:TolB-like protein
VLPFPVGAAFDPRAIRIFAECDRVRIMTSRRFAFGPLVLDSPRGLLLKDGAPVVSVGTRGLALLEALARAGGNIVTRSELLDAAWPNAVIEESNLTVQVAALRRSLGPTVDGGEWIRTVPRVGYRFAVSPDILADAAAAGQTVSLPSAKREASIAVLPFSNMSSDPEQAFFAEGLSDDIITDLSKVPGLVVIARNSSFAYKGRHVDLRQVARELDVRYVVEGSVRRAGGRVRINAQLSDATDNTHLWADRFDGDLADIFALQDEVVARIVAALGTVLPTARPVSRRRPNNLHAYELFMRARPLVTRSPEDNRAARQMLEEAVAIDLDFAEGYAWIALSHHFGSTHWAQPTNHRDALAAAQRSVALDPQNADGHMTLGYLRAYEWRLAEGVAEFEMTLRLNPNHADAWCLFADLRVFEGKPEAAVECAKQAFRLNPRPPTQYFWLLGWAQYAARRYDDAVATLRQDGAFGTGSRKVLAAALARLGRMPEARAVAAEFLSTMPSFSVQAWAATQPFENDTDARHFIEGYIEAGLPP